MQVWESDGRKIWELLKAVIAKPIDGVRIEH